MAQQPFAPTWPEVIQMEVGGFEFAPLQQPEAVDKLMSSSARYVQRAFFMGKQAWVHLYEYKPTRICTYACML